MKRYWKYIKKGLAWLTAIFLMLIAIVVIYVTINKQKIITQVTTELSRKINGTVTISKVELSFFRNFPKISVLLQDVSIADSMIATHHHPILEASEIYAQISVWKLIKKQGPLNGLKIKNASFYLFTDALGYSNDYLLKQQNKQPDKKDPSKEKSELKTIELRNVSIILEDQKKEKLHNLQVNSLDVDLDDKDEKSFLFNVDANILVHHLAFNLPRGSFLKEKKFSGNFDMRFDKLSKQLNFDSINIKINEQRFNLTGIFDLEGPAPQFSLRIHTDNIVYDKVKTLLPQRIANSLSIVEINNPVDGDANITGPLRGGEPLINITWRAKEIHLATPFLDFDEAKFTGFYTNEVVPGLPRKDPNSRIVINNFSALWHNLPVHSNRIEILNLDTPTLTVDLQSSFPLTTLNNLIETNSLKLTSGNAFVNMTYSGPITRNDKTNSFLNGSINFKNGTVLYKPRNVEMQQVNATMLFKNSDIIIENFQTVVLKNNFVMQGVARNLLTLINTAPNNINIDWDISTPFLNLNNFVFLLGAEKKNAVKKNDKNSLSDIAAQIDGILDKGRLNVHLKANKLEYKKFEAENVNADVSILADSYLINHAGMNHAGGQLGLSGSLVPDKNINKAKINMTISNVDVGRLFRAFENFGQDGITYKNLEGKLSAKGNASLALDDQGRIDPASLVSALDFSLKNGALNDFEPIKKLQNFIFKKRDFENIRFAELKNHFDISNQEIRIKRMEIQSTVLSLFVEGIYRPTGNTDISIQVPLNNLNKRDSTYLPKNIGIKQKTGRSIFIRGQPGEDKLIKFKLDLFNKFKKEQDKE